MSQAVQTRTIAIKVLGDATGARYLKDLARDFGLVNNNVSKLSGTVSLFSKIAGFSFLGMGVHQLMEMSDSVQTLKDRLTILTGSSSAAKQVFEELRERAARTKTSVADLGIIYARLANSTKNMKMSSKELLDVTELLQNTFRLSGTTTGEATAAAIQLSQGFASGQLRGQELRSVLEQNVVVGDLLSKTFDISRGKMYKFAEQGRLTADVVLKALQYNAKEVNEQASKLSQTFGQTMTVSMDQLRVKVSELNESFGLSNGLAKALDWVIRNSETIIKVFEYVGVAWAGLKIEGWLSAIKNAGVTFFDLGASVGRLVGWLTELGPLLPLLGTTAIGVAGIAGAAHLLNIEWDDLIPSFDFFKEKTLPEVREEIKKLETELGGMKGLEDFDPNYGPGAVYQNLAYQLKTAREEAEKLSLALRSPAITPDPKSLSGGEWANIFDPLNKLRNQNITLDAALPSTMTKPVLPPAVKEEKPGPYVEINKMMHGGKGDVEAYAAALDKANKAVSSHDFELGKKDWFEFQKALKEVDMERINRQFSRGKMSIEEFNKAVEDNKVEQLELKLKQGTISLREYEAEVVKVSERLGKAGGFRVGVQDYLTSVGTLSQGIANLTKDTFKSLEDSMVQSIRSGKFEFADFEKTVLDGLVRIAVQSQVVAPLANAFGSVNWSSFFTSGTPGTGGTTTPPGNVDGMLPDTGGFHGKAGPTPLPTYGKAEATPVVVNIVNQAGAEVTQTESTGPDGSRMIDVLITSRVREGIANGTFDSQFSQTYGLRRRGV